MKDRSFAQGKFNGTGAAVYIGIGFIPDWVKVWNGEDADVAMIIWNRNMLAIADIAMGEVFATAAGITGDPRAVGDTGIVLYYGGELISATSTVYLKPIPDSERNQIRNSSTGKRITTWTIDTSGSYTGHFDQGVNTTYVGEGSLVSVDGRLYGLHTITNDGDASDEVYLFGGSLGVYAPSGKVDFIGPMYDFIGCAAGDTTLQGFGLTATSVTNVSGELCCFEAGTY